MNKAVTTNTNASEGALQRLQERWRPLGVFTVALSPDGRLVWREPEMPQALALLVGSETFSRAMCTEPDAATDPVTLLPGICAVSLPVLRRRKLAMRLGVVAHVGTVSPHAEELQRFASHARTDAQALAARLEKLPLVPLAQLPAIAALCMQMHEDISAVEHASQESSEITGQLSAVYEEISLLHKIGAGMRFNQKPEEFLATVFRDVQMSSAFRGLLVVTTDGGSADFKQVATAGAFASGRPDLPGLLRGPLQQAITSGEMVLCNSTYEDAECAALAPLVKRFICIPLKREKRVFGAVLAVDRTDDRPFDSADLKLLGNVASQCSIFLENAALYQDMQDLFMGVLHALTRSIDAKDAYTRGHSQRVAELSRMLAEKMGLPDEQCQRIYLSGLLHDVGKIGVPEAVLCKTGRLSEEEFAAIRKHPTIGGQILGNIRQLQDIMPGVLHHHERWDGRGYPGNLAGENIPLLGRIIALADSFDAMTSTRTYRPALPMDHVLAEMDRCAGSQFDPALLRIFGTLDFSHYLQLVEEKGVPLTLCISGGNLS